MSGPASPCRLVVVSHSCVIPANQATFAALAAQEGLDLHLIAPQQWQSSLRGPLTFRARPDLADRSHPLPVRRPGNLHLHHYPDLPAVLREINPDLVYLDEDAHSLVAAQVLKASRHLGFALIATAKQNLAKRLPFPFSRLQRAVYRIARGLAATSEECLQVARRQGFSGPAEIVYYGIDTRHFRPGPPHPPDSPLRVGYAGRLAAEKGVEDLITAVAQSSSQQPLQLVIIGSGPAEGDLRRLAGEYLPPGAVAFCGDVPHEAMPAQYQALEVLVLPSHTESGWKEQFGRVLAEAMACEVPVVGSSSGFIPEMIAATGGGVTFPEGDLDALAQALQALAADPAERRRLGAAGRESVIRLYDCEVIAQRLQRLIAEVCPPAE